MDLLPPDTKAQENGEYVVLARKYRPRDFSTMIGQEALVRTLRNAFETGRLAHAFLLAGVRGVGKTTTARIVARALNCQEDGRTTPAADPCGHCESCRAISEDRSVDVLEIDAASHTGVDNIRELLDGVKYAPVSSRYKIYIIDEVHMLSKGAFNALLKTLEEPPAHVKFLFATTEADRVPITVRSRCQRFDLRRISADDLATFFATLVEKEGVTIEDEALQLIARAADGSARDGLSLLDQAIALSQGNVTSDDVRAMLGLSDQGRILDLFKAIASGQPEEALSLFDALYADGADPAGVIRSLAEFVHDLTRLHVTRGKADLGPGEANREAIMELGRGLSMPQLSRFWQAALAGLSEVQSAFQPSMAAEMVVMRLCYLAQMPDPSSLITQMRNAGASGGIAPGDPGPRTAPGDPGPREAPGDPSPRVTLAPTGAPVSASDSAPQAPLSAPNLNTETPTPPQVAPPEAEPPAKVEPAASVPPIHDEEPPIPEAPDWGDLPPLDDIPPAMDEFDGDGELQPEPEPEVLTLPGGFDGLVDMVSEHGSPLLGAQMAEDVHFVSFEPPRLELRLTSRAPRDLPKQVQDTILDLTGERLTVALSDAEGELPLAEARRNARQAELEQAAKHPTVQAALQAFPSAKVQDVRYKPHATPQE